MKRRRVLGILLLMSTFLFPYFFSVPYRFDQILIPIVVLYCLLIHKVDRTFFFLLMSLFTVCFVLPLFSTILHFSHTDFIGISNFIKESQNLLKPFFYSFFGYFLLNHFGVQEKQFHAAFKLLIVAAFLFSFTTLLAQVSTGTSRNEVNDFLVKYYHLHPFVSSTFRFPGILMQPATAGVYFAFMSTICLMFKYSPIYLVLVILEGLLSNTKVLWFSLPFFIFNFVINMKNPKNIAKFLLLFVILLSTFYVFFGNMLGQMFDFIFGVIKTDPFAGRLENFVAENIAIILGQYPFLGIGFSEFGPIASNYGTWDSLFYYELTFGGIFGLLIKSMLLLLLFVYPFRDYNSRMKLSILILFLNVYLAGIGTSTFYQERIGDLIFIFFGFYYALNSSKNILYRTVDSKISLEHY